MLDRRQIHSEMIWYFGRHAFTSCSIHAETDLIELCIIDTALRRDVQDWILERFGARIADEVFFSEGLRTVGCLADSVLDELCSAALS